MFISDQSVRRPVFASVISMLLVILGLAAMTNLPVRQYPDVDSPVVSIDTRYRGASAEVVETKVTQVIEDQIDTATINTGSGKITVVGFDGRPVSLKTGVPAMATSEPPRSRPVLRLA